MESPLQVWKFYKFRKFRADFCSENSQKSASFHCLTSWKLDKFRFFLHFPKLKTIYKQKIQKWLDKIRKISKFSQLGKLKNNKVLKVLHKFEKSVNSESFERIIILKILKTQQVSAIRQTEYQKIMDFRVSLNWKIYAKWKVKKMTW